MSEPLVVFDGVVKRYGSITAVKHMDLTIDKGEFVALMGPSGCGKTTTLRMLAGLEQPSEGEVRIAGRVMNDVAAHERDTPLVWQSLALFPFLNVRQNVEFGLRMRRVDAPERRRRAIEWLERMGLKGFDDRRIDQLSGGQRQRVALARSLVTEPEMLLLDEPLSALDAHLVIRMQGVLTRLQRELGITFVYVTHSQSEAFAMADRVVIMGDGEISQSGLPRGTDLRGFVGKQLPCQVTEVDHTRQRVTVSRKVLLDRERIKVSIRFGVSSINGFELFLCLFDFTQTFFNISTHIFFWIKLRLLG